MSWNFLVVCGNPACDVSPLATRIKLQFAEKRDETKNLYFPNLIVPAHAEGDPAFRHLHSRTTSYCQILWCTERMESQYRWTWSCYRLMVVEVWRDDPSSLLLRLAEEVNALLFCIANLQDGPVCLGLHTDSDTHRDANERSMTFSQTKFNIYVLRSK